jgi:GNAT superfamily N-acetyltransferase
VFLFKNNNIYVKIILIDKMEENKVVHLSVNSQGFDTWVYIIGVEVVGHIYMKVELENRIKFLDAWVHQDHRRKGIYRKLWETRWQYVNENYSGYVVYAWCKESSLPLLLEMGFDMGESATYVEKNIE